MTFHLFNQLSLDLVPDRVIIQFMFKAWIQQSGHLKKGPDLIILQNTFVRSLHVLTSHMISSTISLQVPCLSHLPGSTWIGLPKPVF